MEDKVVVIGGAGFLGSHIADALSEMDYEVTIFDSRPSSYLRPDQEMIVGDIQNEKVLYECLKGARYVYHLAGIADIGVAKNCPTETVRHNILGSAIVLENCLKAEVKRFLFASTVYVYSQRGSFYRVTKQAVELLIEAYLKDFDLEYTILRYGSLYGPRSQEWNGLKRYVTQAVKQRRIVFPGSGEERREYIHVQDAAHMSAALLAPEYANQCFTLTGTQILTYKELLQIIREVIGEEVELKFRPEMRSPFHYDFTPYRFSPRMARKIVANEFVDIGQGILELVEEVYHGC